jgi:hypothetical protein
MRLSRRANGDGRYVDVLAMSCVTSPGSSLRKAIAHGGLSTEPRDTWPEHL